MFDKKKSVTCVEVIDRDAINLLKCKQCKVSFFILLYVDLLYIEFPFFLFLLLTVLVYIEYPELNQQKHWPGIILAVNIVLFIDFFV